MLRILCILFGILWVFIGCMEMNIFGSSATSSQVSKGLFHRRRRMVGTVQVNGWKKHRKQDKWVHERGFSHTHVGLEQSMLWDGCWVETNLTQTSLE